VARQRSSGALAPLDIDFTQRIHGHSCSNQARRKNEVVGAKKRVLSAAGRAAIVKAAKKRWAKVRAQANKVAG